MIKHDSVQAPEAYKYTLTRISKDHLKKLHKLAKKHKRSATKQLEYLIDEAK